MNLTQLKTQLDAALLQYNRPEFILKDPIQIPHKFNKLQDIEIAAFFASILAWGRREMIIKSATKLIDIFNNAPYEYILNSSYADFEQKLGHFAHRTIQTADILYCFRFLQQHYQQYESLETAFLPAPNPQADKDITRHLNYFYQQFFSLDNPTWRTKKHITCPNNGSSCKRLCMFLRWMVRKDIAGVDLGLWQNITTNQLVMPLDVHILNIVKRLALVTNPQPNWKTALALTQFLQQLDPNDAVKYDLALFSLDIER